MNVRERRVVKLPLESLWNDDGPLSASKRRALTELDLQNLLRNSPFAFAVADVGRRLVWSDPVECFALWKMEVRPHLYTAEKPCLDDYPGEYFYAAYEWRLWNDGVVVVLEKNH